MLTLSFFSDVASLQSKGQTAAVVCCVQQYGQHPCQLSAQQYGQTQEAGHRGLGPLSIFLMIEGPLSIRRVQGQPARRGSGGYDSFTYLLLYQCAVLPGAAAWWKSQPPYKFQGSKPAM